MAGKTIKYSNEKKTTNHDRIRRVCGSPSEKNNTPERITITYVQKKHEKRTTRINNDTKRKHICFSLRRHVVCTNAAQIQPQYLYQSETVDRHETFENRGHHRKGSTRSERRKPKHNLPRYMVAIVADVNGAVCQLYLRH